MALEKIRKCSLNGNFEGLFSPTVFRMTISGILVQTAG